MGILRTALYRRPVMCNDVKNLRMPISLKSKEKAKSLLEAIKIGIHTVDNSTHLDLKTKLAFNELHQYSENIIKIGFMIFFKGYFLLCR